MTLDDSIQGSRLRVLQAATSSGNVSATCRRFGISRTQFYRLRARHEQYGPDGVHPKRHRARRGRPTQVSVTDERRVVAEALAWPTRGPQWISDRLRRDGRELPPTTIWRVLHRHQLGTRRERLAVLEQRSATQLGLLTDRTHRARRASRHVAAHQPGDLCCLDTFYVGKLKGVGKIWQLTACDAASSYAFAQVIVGEVTAELVVTFLLEVVVPGYRAAGWTLWRVLTDNGKESKGAFVAACAARRIRHTRTKPGHAWTNGFVERLQGTILHEHWRIAFRRQYFTSLAAVRRSLDGFLHFYNTERSHRGYRLGGRTPHTVFAGVITE